MSCACNTCNCSPCTCDVCDPNNEPISSALNNFITQFFGTLSKSCVNDQVVWVLPCDLDIGNPSFPREAGEGLACYFSRFITNFLAAQQVSIGNKGYATTGLSNTDKTISRDTDFINQNFSGNLTGPVSIIFSSTDAVNGDEFYVSIDNVVVGTVNTLTIKSDGNVLDTYNVAGTYNGFLKLVYTGTIWKITQKLLNIS